jgi:hypothetical protein
MNLDRFQRLAACKLPHSSLADVAHLVGRCLERDAHHVRILVEAAIQGRMERTEAIGRAHERARACLIDLGQLCEAFGWHLEEVIQSAERDLVAEDPSRLIKVAAEAAYSNSASC